jgi:protein SCO1/2
MSIQTRRQFLTLGGGLLGAAALAGCAGGVGSSFSLAGANNKLETISQDERRRRRFVNNLLVTHDGQNVRFYDDLMKDKTVLINFMYVACKNEGFCPMMSFNLSKVQALLGDRLGKDVFMYSITLDPENDTPKVLASYAKHFKAKPGGWRFITGAKQDIADVRGSLGFRWANPKQDSNKQEHIGILKYGIEPLERWGTCPALSKPEAIAAYLDWMTPNGKRPLG